MERRTFWTILAALALLRLALMATVPVFETKLDTVPENSMTARMSVRSPGQNRNNAAPIFSAMPVLNSAAPITLIAT